MKNQPIPKQFFTLSVLLLLWFCSFGFFDGNTKNGWGANVLASQTVAVMACYFISRDWWSWAVIMIEGICAMYTGIVLYRWDVLDDFFYSHHHGFMVACFIISQTITISTIFIEHRFFQKLFTLRALFHCSPKKSPASLRASAIRQAKFKMLLWLLPAVNNIIS